MWSSRPPSPVARLGRWPLACRPPRSPLRVRTSAGQVAERAAPQCAQQAGGRAVCLTRRAEPRSAPSRAATVRPAVAVVAVITGSWETARPAKPRLQTLPFWRGSPRPGRTRTRRPARARAADRAQRTAQSAGQHGQQAWCASPIPDPPTPRLTSRRREPRSHRTGAAGIRHARASSSSSSS